MTLTQLSIFIKIIDLQNFSKVAEELYITQPAVSHSISDLESELSIKLIQREKNKIFLTDTGTKVLKHARIITYHAEQIKQEAASSLGLQAGMLKIGSFGSVSANLLPGIMHLFKLKYPKIDLKIFEGTENEIRDWISSRMIDIGFVTLPCCTLKTVFIVSDDMMVVLSENHPLSSEKSVNIEQLNEYPVMITWNSNCQILVKKAFKSFTGKFPPWKYKVSNIATMLGMVKEELGIAVIPEFAIPKDISHVKILQIEPKLKREIGLASLTPFKDSTPTVLAFIEIAKEWIKKQGGSSKFCVNP